MGEGHKALARVIGIAREHSTLSAAELARECWPDFGDAVAAVITELRESEADGIARWQEVRHPRPPGG